MLEHSSRPWRVWAFAGVFGITSLLLAACGGGGTPSSSSSSGPSGKVAFLLPENVTARWEEQDKPFFIAAMKKYAPNVQVQVVNALNDQTKQQSQAEAALTNGAKVLVIIPVDQVAAASIVNEANQQKVPVIAYDRLIKNSPVADYVSVGGVDVGKLQGQWLADHTKAGDRIAVINGSPTDDNAHLFNQGYMGVLQPLFDSGQRVQVANIWTPGWDPAKAQSEMDQILTKNSNNLQGVLSANDGMAGGIIASLQTQGLAGKVPITGLDATLAADAVPDRRIGFGDALGKPRAWVLAHDADLIGQREHHIYASLIARRVRGEPVAYLRGYVEWFGMELEITPDVLIPRPETELVAERAIKLARKEQVLLVADIGTGSGALAIAMARHLVTARVFAVDSSHAALGVAAKNVHKHGVADRVTLVKGSLLTPLGEKPDLIVANLPYVAAGLMPSLERSVRFEPPDALCGGADGLELYADMFDQMADRGALARQLGHSRLVSEHADKHVASRGRRRGSRRDGESTEHNDPEPAHRSRVPAIHRCGGCGADAFGRQELGRLPRGFLYLVPALGVGADGLDPNESLEIAEQGGQEIMDTVLQVAHGLNPKTGARPTIKRLAG